MRNIHFNRISIVGFRGRNFTLNMNPRGQHTVFVMDGNTGKTTTIELLRWCFKHRSSNSVDNFEHMWTNPAHLLDDEIIGSQECVISINFNAEDESGVYRDYKFSRTVIGEYIEDYGLVGDKITSISDILEIDSGVQVIRNDRVFDYLYRNFRFDDCAEYFCFDGEKARKIMQIAGNIGKIDTLLKDVNKRVTHPKLQQFELQLNNLRNRVLKEARSNISDRALKLSFDKIRRLSDEEVIQRGHVREYKEKIERQELAMSRVQNEVDDIDSSVDQNRIDNLIARKGYEIKQTEIKSEINNSRIDILKSMSKWIQSDYDDKINEIKSMLRETGKLPEPYRADLISICIDRNMCQICGRELDEDSKNHIHDLSKLIASHKVQEFLSNTFSMSKTSFDPRTYNRNIRDLITDYELYQSKINEISLSDTEQELIDNMSFLKTSIESMDDDKHEYIKKLSIHETKLSTTQIDLNEEQERNEALHQYKIILDQIKPSREIIDDASNKIKEKAIEIISEVMSEAVSSILGPEFSARFTEEKGLLLGQNGFYGKEKGGYSGRLILSYCFAEAMTLVDPIIVDTPVGNIGSHREKLAEHLFANHKQVVLLCLPTELENFSNIISEQPITIVNG